jgi:hypothetical protein
MSARPIEAPADVGHVEQLLWALRHPLPSRQMIAAQILGERSITDLLARSGAPSVAAVAAKTLQTCRSGWV